MGGLLPAGRSLLLGGDLVRIDFPDPTLAAHGVVASDRSRAIYSFAFLGRSEVTSLGRIRLPGLDPSVGTASNPCWWVRYKVGLKAPEWWQVQGIWPAIHTTRPKGRRFGPDTPRQRHCGHRGSAQLYGAAAGSHQSRARRAAARRRS